MPALMTLWIGPFTMRAVKAPTGVDSLKPTVNSLTLLWDPPPKQCGYLNPRCINRNFNSPLRSSWTLALWGSCAISFQSFNSLLRSSYNGPDAYVHEIICLLQFSFEILSGQSTYWSLRGVGTTFNSLLRSSWERWCDVTLGEARKPSILFWDPRNKDKAKGQVARCILQFSFEILVV